MKDENGYKKEERRWKSLRTLYKDPETLREQALSLLKQYPRPIRMEGKNKVDIYEVRGRKGVYIIPQAIPPSAQFPMMMKILEEVIIPDPKSNLLQSNPSLYQQIYQSKVEGYTEGVTLGILTKLRWITTGYHYNWTDRSYHPSDYSDFSPTLDQLAKQYTAMVLGERLEADAAIVNFYTAKDRLCGHKDDVEHCGQQPLVSYSSGNEAIFLLGGVSYEDIPIPIHIQSGDIIILSGSARECIHGIPLILPESIPSQLQQDILESTLSKPWKSYLLSCRINTSIRKVYPSPPPNPTS